MPELSIASFNVHAGIDGWGRPYDVESCCAELDADVLVLQENWSADGEPSIAHRVADMLGYELLTTTLARGKLYPPCADDVPGFGPPVWSRPPVGIRLDRDRRRRPRLNVPWREPLERGEWGVAVMTRLPITGSRVIDLSRLARDPAHRSAIEIELDVDGAAFVFVGVHMSHFSQGSSIQYRRLRRALPPRTVPAAVAGDMNLWRGPLRLLLPGWKPMVRGRTWPAPRPRLQVDHILARGGVTAVEGAVSALGLSDHRAVRARVRFTAQRREARGSSAPWRQPRPSDPRSGRTARSTAPPAR